MFENENLLQTWTGAPNSCSYADVTAASIDQAIMKQKETEFHEILFFGWYREDCLVLYYGMAQMKNFNNDIILSPH